MLRRALISVSLSAVALASIPSVVLAQDVVMRRPLPMSARAAGTTGWYATDWQTVDSSGNPVPQGQACGNYTETRAVSCRNGDGQTVGDYFCQAAPKPDASRTMRHDEGCTYAWQVGGWQDPGASCTLSKTETRSVTCQRDQDQVVMSDSFCSSSKPNSTQTVQDFSTCTYSWQTDAYRDPGASCTDAEVQPRDVWCQRDLDAVHVADSSCSAATKPAASQSVRDISGCTYSWQTGSYVDPGPTCTRSKTETRSVVCQRSLNAETATDADCSAAGPKPAASEVVPDYATCTYQAVNYSEASYDSTCSASATSTRTAQCQRSNDGGEIVDSTECTSRGVALTQTSTAPNYSSCSNSWQAGHFVDPGAACTATKTETRSVTCNRDLDGSLQPDGSCNAATRPSSSTTVADYSACSYSAVNYSGYSYSSTCSSNATRTRTAQCQRSDGTIVADGECTSRGVSLTDSATVPNYSSCGTAWQTGSYVDPGAACGNKTETRSVYCQRQGGDYATLPDSSCNAGSRPASTTVVYDTSGCGYSLAQQPQSCSNGQQTVVNSCTRSDGQPVSASFCGVPSTQTQSCTSYGWYVGGFGGYGACQAPGVQYQYRDVHCQANNGGSLSTVDDSLCGGGKPSNANSQGCTYYSYSWYVGGFGGWDNTCSSYATQYRDVHCQRSPDNASVDDGFCASAGSKPAASQSASVYSGCSYSANYGAFSTCSNSSQYRTNTCTRNQTGESVDPPTYCGINSTDTQSCVSSCSNPNSLYASNASNTICTGNVRYLSPYDADTQGIYNHGASWYIARHPEVKCLGYVDMEPQGGSEADSAGMAYVVSDGTTTASHAPVYNMYGYPYPAVDGANYGMVGAPGTWSFFVLGACR